MDQQSILALQNNKLTKNSDFSKLELDKIKGKLHSINSGDILYKDGDSADSMYLMVNGEVNLLKKDEDGITDHVTYSDNDFFGAKELFENVDRYSTIVSLMDSYLIELNKEEIESLMQQDEGITVNVKSSLANLDESKRDETSIEKYSFDEDDDNYDSLDEPYSDNDIDNILSSIDEQEQVVLSNDKDFDKEPLVSFDDNEAQASEIDMESVKRFVDETKEIEKQKAIKDKDDNFFMTSSQFSLVLKALQLLNTNVKIDDVLRNIVDVAVDLTHADRGTLYIVDKDKNEIWSKVLIANEIEEIRLKIGEGVAGWVAENGELLNIENVNNDDRFQSRIDDATGYTTKNMLCFPIKNKRQEIVAVIQLLNNLTGKFSAEEELFLNAISLNIAAALENSSLVEELVAAERSTSLDKMGNFLGYDIKKPIQTSKRYAEHLSKKDLPSESKQIVDMLLEQLSYVADKVETTSEYTEGTIILRKQTVSLNDTLTKYSSDISNLLKKYDCIIEHELDKDVNVHIDRKEFYQCYYNIVKNSCEAFAIGGNIFVSTNIINDKIHINIDDNGRGIERKDLAKVFEPFWTKDKTQNSGLGLSISKKIIEDHGGNVEIKSEKKSGTIVIIKLPIR
ncbi:MAG: GAF domain-containing protein [Ignavibacteriae bacterium]|nr:GAF domain-containing protein [Ignavibacteriota bacterium]